MAGETTTPEQVQGQLDEALAKVAELTGQVRGLAAERDQYRSQMNGGAGGGGGGGGRGSGGGVSPHVLAKALGIEGDFSEVDEYYVPRSQYQRDLQIAVNTAYGLARGDMLVLRAIDKAIVTYGDLAKFDSPLSKKTLEILQKEGYATFRKDGYGQFVAPRSWEDLVYEDVKAFPRSARMASTELLIEQQAAEKAATEAKSAEGAAGMASGGAPAGGSGTAPSEEAFVRAAEAGDVGGMREVLGQHIEAVTGRPA